MVSVKYAYIGTRVPEDLKKKLEAAAARDDRSVSKYLERLISRDLGEDND